MYEKRSYIFAYLSQPEARHCDTGDTLSPCSHCPHFLLEPGGRERERELQCANVINNLQFDREVRDSNFCTRLNFFLKNTRNSD